MPISPIILQRRHAELGRIRLGHKTTTQNGGQRPAKLDKFRFTSPSEGYIRDLAELYGGTPQPWDNSGKPEWEVYSDAKSIPVIAVKGGMSQFMEQWSGGGCRVRCDGNQDIINDRPCVCVGMAREEWQCKPYTRLSVMIRDLDAIGVWRLESHGWHAAAELPTVAELAAFVGDLVPADLHLVERRSVKDGQTSRFVVPVLDLRIGAARLREVVAAVSSGGAALGSPTARPALEAAAPDPGPYGEWHTAVDDAASKDDLNAIWHAMLAENLVGQGVKDPTAPAAVAFLEHFKAKAAAVPVAGPSSVQDDADGDVVDGEIVEEPPGDPNVLWQQILAAAGEQGMTTADLEDDFAATLDGVTAADATAGDMRRYLDALLGRAA